jgi:hypothetical protein
MAIAITMFQPMSGGPETEVTITLTGMTQDFTIDNTKVYIGEERLHDVRSVTPGGDASSGTIRVVIDEMARTGKFSVQGGESLDSTTAADDFRVTGSTETTPTITSITDQSGMSREFKRGQTLTATGRNLNTVTEVRIGPTGVTVSSSQETMLRFRVPPAVSDGQYFVSIVYGSGNMRSQYNRRITIAGSQ